MIFQHRCHLNVSPEDAGLAQKALCTPGMVKPGADLVIGECALWDGSTVEARLCAVPEQPAALAVAVFDCNGKLKGFTRSQTYQTAFEFSIGSVEYMVALHTDKTLTKETPKEKGKAAHMKEISTDDLRKMDGQEGLILQGCGGPPQEWLDGINDLLTDAGILLDGSHFENISVFHHDGLTNILFPFEGVKLDMGKLAMWRLQTHGQFGGTWLSDYVPNRLGGFIKEQEPQTPQKPKMQLEGQDGNIFAILGNASLLMNQAGMREQIDEMFQRIAACGDYDKALSIINEYVDTELSGPAVPETPKKSAKKKGTKAYER